jgi:hypothetical protein
MRQETSRESKKLPSVITEFRAFVGILFIVFLCSLPFVNPIVHGDGVGYYAYARAPLIQHNLRFEEDWRHANLYFSSTRILPNGQLRPEEYSETGYVENFFSVGPAMLWSPFLLLAHASVALADSLGAHVSADGFSSPYLLAMAIGTAVYGFLGLLLSFSLARKYVDEHWAFLATLAIWGASSLPVYMYFNPAWSHAHSAFVAALFLWFWDRKQGERTEFQWIVLGLIAGLMVDVYFVNGVFLTIPLIESLIAYGKEFRSKAYFRMIRLFAANLLFLCATTLAFLPTLITRYVIFGGISRFGAYTVLPWDWSAPHWRAVLLSSEHGLLTWTPVLLLSIAGLFCAPRAAKPFVYYLALAAAAFYYVISSYPYWHGMSSFGNRFFISLTPIFVVGLAFLLQRFSQLFRLPRRAFVTSSLCLLLFVFWNLGLIFQWGAHLIPVRGPVSFAEVTHNQFHAVPQQAAVKVRAYLFRRNELMKQIEEKDVEQINRSEQE